MNIRSLITRRLISLSFSPSRSPLRNFSGLASAWLATQKPATVNRKQGPTDILYRRISPATQQPSVTPLLDQWVSEGRSVSKNMLVSIAKSLRKYGRYNHALEVLNWMSHRGYSDNWAGDIAVQLDLISKVHGSAHVEKFFLELPKEHRNLHTYSALLNCYAQEKLVDKAETLWLEMKDLGFSRSSLSYSNMLNLYYQLHNHGKIDDLVREMEREGIRLDKIVYGILLSVYGRDSDVDGVNKIIHKAESDNMCKLDSVFYAIAANCYLRASELKKSVECLKKAEELLASTKKKEMAYHQLLTLYATAGRKDGVWRIWKLCKKYKLYNRDYLCMMGAMLKLNDLEGAEKILKEYLVSTGFIRDMHVPNLLIAAYCRDGLVEKVEEILKVLKGCKANSFTLFHLAIGYVQKKQMQDAVKAVKSALTLCRPTRWKPDVQPVAACLNHLIAEKDMESFGELADLLTSKGFVSEDLHRKLLVLALSGDKVDDALKEDFGARVAESEEQL